MGQGPEDPLVLEARKFLYRYYASIGQYFEKLNTVVDMCDKCARAKSEVEVKKIIAEYTNGLEIKKKATSGKQVHAPARGAKKKAPPKPAVKQRGRVSRVRRKR